MAKPSNHYILILCGGSGPRLWPLSRSPQPKQFLKIFGKQSLLQETIGRFKKFVPSSNIFVISHQKYIAQLNHDIGRSIPKQNILTEPLKKNTAMAIVYGSAIIKKMNPNAIITSAPADHFISSQIQFQKDLSKAVYIAQHQTKIVALGTLATSPNPAYGYILPKNNSFVEKPDEKTALKLLKSGAYWNCGIYTFSLTSLVSEIQTIQPIYFRLFNKILSNSDSLVKIYKQSPELSFDVAISEKTSQLSLIPIKFSWSDIGEWKSIYQKLPKKEAGFSTLSVNTNYIQINSQRCLVSGIPNKIIGLVGVKNLAVIDTIDGLLICNIDSEDSYRVRDLVSQMVENSNTKKYFLNKK